VLAFLAVLVLLAGACAEPPVPETKVIVGATLIDGVNPPLEYSVIVVREGKIAAVGPQQSTPIPPGSEKVNGLGKFVVASNRSSRLEPGSPADLLLLSGSPVGSSDDYHNIERRMVAGKWVDR
jgi:imidazolonepropionase-like amidohydrolase